MTKRIVKKVDFSKEGAHLAICKNPANGQEEVTILKSKEVNEDLDKKVKGLEDTVTNLEKDLKTKEDEIMAEKKKKEDVDLQKSIDEAVQTALEKEKEKFNEELQKAKDEAAELRKAAEKKEKDEMVELCKGYSFVEDADSLADSLFLCKSVKGFDVILDTLEKARTAIKSALETEIGTDEEKDLTKNTEVPDHISKTSELIKARKEGK